MVISKEIGAAMSTDPIINHNYHVHRPHPKIEPETGAELSPPAIKGPRSFATPRAERRLPCSVVPGYPWYMPVKRVCDGALALVLLAFAAPIVFLAALLVKLSSRGPAFYRQVRLGKDGRPFTLLKLRTMKNNAEAETGPVWSVENDSRITSLGQLLRRTHIDEFPQLVNVALGQMSLVGPRPERPEFVAKLDWEIPYYRERLKVRPGITGLAQLRLPPDASLECVHRKVIYDVYYVRHVNPALDVKLLCLTAARLVGEVCRFCWRGLVLPNKEEIERGFYKAVGIVDNTAPAAHVTVASISARAEMTNDE
jgi:lipopolysaccharide/colanic/teichoic acid biosynthesis glycosyltransferase